MRIQATASRMMTAAVAAQPNEPAYHIMLAAQGAMPR